MYQGGRVYHMLVMDLGENGFIPSEFHRLKEMGVFRPESQLTPDQMGGITDRYYKMCLREGLMPGKKVAFRDGYCFAPNERTGMEPGIYEVLDVEPQIGPVFPRGEDGLVDGNRTVPGVNGLLVTIDYNGEERKLNSKYF